MPFLQCSFHSNALGLACSMNVLLPQEAGANQIGMESNADAARGETSGFPVLYLLHGLSDDHTIWMRRTSLERYAAARGIAVIMPAVNRSFYTDMASGPKYWSFISEELPAICQRMFRISRRREDTFVAGLSMGGYGAFKLAMRCPDRFAAAASLSGVLDMASRIEKGESPEWRDELTHIFGDLAAFKGSDNDTMHLLSRLAQASAPTPALYLCCGTEDFLYQSNTAFRDHAHGLGVEITYEEHAGHAHEWGYWDQQIQRVLDWLPLPTT